MKTSTAFKTNSAIGKKGCPKARKPVADSEIKQFAPYLHAMHRTTLDDQRAAHRHAYCLEHPVDVFGAPDEDAVLDHFGATRALWDRCRRTGYRNFPFIYYLSWFRSMTVIELANAVRTWGNMPLPMVEAGTAAYRERKSEVNAVPRHAKPPAYVARESDPVGPDGETEDTHDFVTEKHKTGGKGQVVAAGTWVRREDSACGN
tara:strand:+ start:1368 stop:1976 length:609 start_codon:yes stop_codon:yes gene_type:complete